MRALESDDLRDEAPVLCDDADAVAVVACLDGDLHQQQSFPQHLPFALPRATGELGEGGVGLRREVEAQGGGLHAGCVPDARAARNVTAGGSAASVGGMKQRQQQLRVAKADRPPAAITRPPWLHEVAFDYLRRAVPETPLRGVEDAFVDLLAALYGDLHTDVAVAAELGVSSRVLREWHRWLADHRPVAAGRVVRLEQGHRPPGDAAQ